MRTTYAFAGLLASLACFLIYYIFVLPHSVDSLPFHAPSFQLGTEKPYSHYEEPPDRPLHLAFNHESSLLYASRGSGVIEEWDVNTLAQTRTFRTNNIFSYISAANSLLTKTVADNVEILELDTKHVTPLARDFYVHSDTDPTGSFLLMSTGAKSLEMWKLDNKRLSKTWDTQKPVRNGVAIAANGAYVAAAEGTYDSVANFHHTTIQIWERDNELPRFLYNGEHDQEVHGVWGLLFSPDGEMIAVDTQLNRHAGFTIWQTRTGKPVFQVRDLESYWVRALAFSPGSKFLAVGDELGNLMIWDLDLQKKVWQTQVRRQAIHSIAFSSDGHLLAAGIQDSTILVWDVASTLGILLKSGVPDTVMR